MINPAGIPFLTLAGAPRERGRIHGETLRPTIHEHKARWQHELRSELGMEPEEYIALFLAETDFVPAIERWTPDLLEEVRGIAEGAGVGFEYTLVRQLSDEEPWYRFEKKIELGIRPPESCSALGAWHQRGGPPVIAQNMDSPAYYDDHQVLLHIQDPSSPVEALVFTVAGKISLAGLNNQGVGICCNTLLQLDYAIDGLPEDFIVRGFLAQPNLDEALGFMRRVKHASGQNYVVGGPDRVLDLECSAHKICEFTAYPGANRVYHTNHPLVNDDQERHNRRLSRMPPDILTWYKNRQTTYARFASLEKHLRDPARIVDIDTIKAVLSSHDGPVCIDKGTGVNITLGCLIMELSAEPVLHLSPGPPCSTPFNSYRFGG
ncbi:MAG: C45 family autoproteolytic acyltransferase/hydrolase [Chloroflexota bacterium]